MDNPAREAERGWTANTFPAADQRAFGDAWRYELVDGGVVAYAAPTPDHGAILAGLGTALGNPVRGRKDGCRPETGSGAVPRNQLRPTARIPNALARCGDLPRVVFDVVSVSELRACRARNQRRGHLQDTEGVAEIVEIYQDDAAGHIYRRTDGGQWSAEAVDGIEAVLRLDSIALELPLAEIYEFVTIVE
jgi:Uma2 family endonuclease